ncbi:MAG: DUF6325 family protein [Acidimicrobiales bacterium]
MSIGPVEYLIVGFPDNNFRGEIVPELAKLAESGTIGIIDLVFITKDADGTTATFEFDSVAELAALSALEGEVGGIISQADIDHAAKALEPNTSAALLIWEDKWATPFVEALRNANGVLIEGARVPHELVDAAFQNLTEALSSTD